MHQSLLVKKLQKYQILNTFLAKVEQLMFTGFPKTCWHDEMPCSKVLRMSLHSSAKLVEEIQDSSSAVQSRASNEVQWRFHNHGEGFHSHKIRLRHYAMHAKGSLKKNNHFNFNICQNWSYPPPKFWRKPLYKNVCINTEKQFICNFSQPPAPWTTCPPTNVVWHLTISWYFFLLIVGKWLFSILS